MGLRLKTAHSRPAPPVNRTAVAAAQVEIGGAGEVQKARLIVFSDYKIWAKFAWFPHWLADSLIGFYV